MPVKQRIDSRLRELFQHIRPEDGSDFKPDRRQQAEFSPAVAEPTAVEAAKPAPRPSLTAGQPPTPRHTAGLRGTSLVLPIDNGPDSGMALSFQTGTEGWSTLQVIDEVASRAWSEDDRLLVKQVAEQLSLALENARLFQETRLRSEELLKFRLGIERTDNAVFITDVDGRIQYVNDGFEKIYGYSRAEALGNTPRMLNAGTVSATLDEQFWATLRNRETITAETENQTKDGRIVSIAATTAPILDENQALLGFLAIHAEITAQKQAQETIRRRNEYLAASAEIARLVTSTLDLKTIFSRTVNLIHDMFGFYHAAIFIVDERGVNAILQEAAGPSSEELRQQFHAVPVESQTIIGKVAATGQALVANNTALESSYEPEALLPDTKAEAALPLRVGNRIIGALDIRASEVDAFEEDAIGVLQTLADQVAVAIDNARSYELSQQAVTEMRELDRLKSQFLANMSHELRTPLNSIIGFSRVILKGIDGPTTELQQQDLTAIHSAGQHLLGLINDILDLSKIEAGKMELAFEEVNMEDLANSVMSTMSGLLKDKPITLQRKIPSGLPSVRADPIRIRQVMINLLSNAAKFTEQGQITVELAVQQGASGGQDMLISVTDTGPGIAEEDQQKLFQAFSQVDDSPTRRTSGSGLGLSISQHLVQMHSGHIGVKSTIGQGSMFYFSLPLTRPGDADGPQDRKVVLVIDDDTQGLETFRRFLDPHGYRLVAVSDHSRALEQAAQLRPFAVLLDVGMQSTDGWNVLSALRTNAATKDSPVIVCSRLEEHEKGFSLGAVDYLVKPVVERDLLGALERLGNLAKNARPD
jgi:PAS domain S-box-containing protein